MAMQEKHVSTKAIGCWLLESKKKIGDNQAKILLKSLKTPHQNGIFSRLKLSFLWKMNGCPQFSVGIPITLPKICFSNRVINCAKTPLYWDKPS